MCTKSAGPGASFTKLTWVCDVSFEKKNSYEMCTRNFVKYINIRKPDSPAFEWSTFGHNLYPVFEWSGYRIVGTRPICLAFEWLKQDGCQSFLTSSLDRLIRKGHKKYFIHDKTV